MAQEHTWHKYTYIMKYIVIFTHAHKSTYLVEVFKYLKFSRSIQVFKIYINLIVLLLLIGIIALVYSGWRILKSTDDIIKLHQMLCWAYFRFVILLSSYKAYFAWNKTFRQKWLPFVHCLCFGFIECFRQPFYTLTLG